ncbi:type IV secretory system conjugative DNA transfer family protein, partial [Methylorubrum populi]|uniref:type IV secretory system conjugative DNA transfer family protein n=1 Tax=Methylorubrum populi TaxID=223967 RepID=UPI002F35736B
MRDPLPWEMPVSVIRFVFAVLVTLLRWSFFLLFWLCRQLYRALRESMRARSVTHGSARWASLADLVRGRALGGESGIIVGKAFGQFIRFKRDGAVLVCAPQGQGKGVGIVIPNLLDHKGSALVTDPKGENYAVTHRHRGTLGDVWCLNAIAPTLSDGFNPFSMIRVGTEHEADDAAQIADFLVIPESRDKHWDSAAKNLLTALIRYVIDTRPPEQANLATVSELITSAPEKREELLKDMA